MTRLLGRGRLAARRRIEAVAATELLAACLAAGASPVRAAEAVAEVLDGQAAQALAAAAGALRRGEPPEQCWTGLAAVPDLAGVGRILARASVSGTRAAAAMGVEAAGLRARSRAAAGAALARVGVWSVAPLALCFLPAFVCLGVVPIALGLTPALLR
ncbi:MAG TPA: type II secretion system F family protein [Sporichthyaceae bacterium]|nr:type II secretion system F family protein [Sporichthyaceae bacterium]